MQRYFSKELVDNNFILNDDDVYHIRKVMRILNGEFVEVVYNTEVYRCCIQDVNKKTVAKIVEKYETIVSSKPKITLIIPFLKEQKLDLIFQKSTELGVDEIILTELEHSIVKISKDKIANKLTRWQKIMKEASEQSMRVDIPTLRILSKEEIYKLDGLNVICSTVEKDNNIRKVLKKYNNYDKINLVIGPEGGFSKKEEEIFASNGFIKTSLGNQIMRVETVPMFLLSVIRYECME